MGPDGSRPTGRPGLRASDAERERIAIYLSDQAAEGRLTADELDDRVGAAFRAVTVDQLERLVADLPHSPLSPPAAAPPRAPRSTDWRPLAVAALVLFVAVPSVVWAVWFAMLAGAVAVVVVVGALALSLGPFLVVPAAAYALLRRRRELPERPLGPLSPR